MARYHKRKDGLYETSRTINGKRVYFRSKTIKGVDEKILAYNERKSHGRKVADIADEWYSSKENEMRTATANAYAYALRLLQAESISNMRAGDVAPLDCKRYLNDMEQRGYSASTIATILHVLKAVFSYAVLAGDIDVNPASEVTRSRNLPRTVRPALTEDDERKVEQFRGEDYLLGIFLLYTGMRRGEAMAITWQDIDREHGVIHVTKKVNYSTRPLSVDHFLKSSNGKRDVPILAPLAALLPSNRIGLVFADENGNHLTARKFDARWKRYCESVGITATPHQFRHSFATICYEAGIDSISAAAMMGDTPEIVSRIYTELRKCHQDTQAEQVSAFLEMRSRERSAM